MFTPQLHHVLLLLPFYEGRTPWNTWVSCEEDGSSGRCHEVDPDTGYTQQVKVVAQGGNYESFAYDDQDPIATRFFITEDDSLGALTRYTPHPNAYRTSSSYDILNTANGVYEYLVLDDNSMTFTWSRSLTAGEATANAFFPSLKALMYTIESSTLFRKKLRNYSH